MAGLTGFDFETLQTGHLHFGGETGLTGIYDITLRLPPAALQGAGDGGVEEEVGTDYIAAAEHAGFKFVSKKVPQPVVIIDHIDPPTAN